MVNLIKMERLLWLDDYRNPMEGQWLVFCLLKSVDYEVHWVKNYHYIIFSQLTQLVNKI